MTGGGECNTRVPALIPTRFRKVIQELSKNLRYKHNDEFVYTTLIDSGMDPSEAGRRLKMIHDIIEIAGKHSVEDVYTMLKECNLDANEAAQRLLYIDTFHEVKKKHERRKTISGDVTQENKQIRGNQWRGDKGTRGTFYLPKVFEDNGSGRNLSSFKESSVTSSIPRFLRTTLPGHPGKENNIVLPVPNSCANENGTTAISNGNYNHKLAPELSADRVSSASDHVVVSSQNTKHICAVGTIKCEIVKRNGSDESNATKVADSELKSNVTEKNQNSSPVNNPIQNNQQPLQLLNGPPKVNASELTDLDLEETSKLDAMMEKLTLSSHQAVIFPDHLQVPENYKCQFVFGSFDATDDCQPMSVTESTQQNEVVKESPLSNETVSKIAQEGDVQDHVVEDNISSNSSALNHELTNAESVPPLLSEFQNLPVLQTNRDYSYGYMPPVMGSHLVQLDIPDLQQNGNSQVVSAVGQPTPATQPAIAGRNSIALSPPVFPYFRPYPNYIPYNPYFPHMYLPQGAHLLNHGVFPHQPPPPPTTNAHIQAATATVKSPTSQGSSNEDIISEAKVNNTVSTVQQSEDPQAWTRAPVHDLPNILPNYYYFPHGHAFSPLQAAALYHSSQTLTAQSTLQPPLIYQPQPTGTTVEPMVQPLTSYHQHPHASQVNQTDTGLLNTGTG